MKEESTSIDTSQQEASILRSRYLWMALLTGILIGAGVTTAIFIVAESQQHETTRKEIHHKKSHEILQAPIQIHPKGNPLIDERQTIRKTIRKAIRKGTESEQAISEVPTASETVENHDSRDSKKRNKTLVETENTTIKRGRFTVYIHYNGKKQKQTMNKLAKYLRTKGYTVPEIEHVANRSRDIRYFHKEDCEGVGYLVRDLQDFLKNTAGIHNIDVKSVDLSKVYPGAAKGALELWIYF